MKYRHKEIIKIVVFIIIFIFIFIRMNKIFQPVWFDWNNYDTHQGFYEQPKDTIEVVFLGSSVVVNGISPMKMYEEYGICAYNLATEQQPLMASYFWAKEAYKNHSESLKTIVFDVSTLRNKPKESFYSKAIDNIKDLSNKWLAVSEQEVDFQNRINNFVPLFKYHSRWNDLGQVSFTTDSYVVKDYVRGYNFCTNMFLTSAQYIDYIPELYLDGSQKAISLDTEALLYFDKLASFCEEKSIDLLLIKTPYGWDSANHNAVAEVAEKYQLEFIDFNYLPVYDEIKYNFVIDQMDIAHGNYYGANKVSSWLGKHLIEKYDATDTRGMEKYQFMEEQLYKYNRFVVRTELDTIVSPYEYLSKLKHMGEYTVFVIGKDECTAAMSKELRNSLASLGFERLKELEYRASYLAILNGEEVVYEESATEESCPEKTPIYLEGTLDSDVTFQVKSGGHELGNIASCIINGIEYAKNDRGLNIIVYDNITKAVVHTTCFDTFKSEERESANFEKRLEQYADTRYEDLEPMLQRLYSYNLKMKLKQLPQVTYTEYADNEFLIMLNEYMKKEDCAILLTVKDEATGALSTEVKQELNEIGLSVLSKLEYRDSYIGIVVGGEVLLEGKNHDTEPMQIIWEDFKLISGGQESGNVASIIKDKVDYSVNERGLNVVVYDTAKMQVIEKQNFDTFANPQLLPNELIESE